MKLKQLIFWITVLAVFAMSARISVDTDTWWHLRAGQWIFENRVIPQSDPFSHTRYGETWQYPGWLIEVPMYLVFRTFGPGGLNLWTAMMVTLAFVFTWHTLVGGPFMRAFVVILAATVSAVYWAARPYLVTFVLTAVFLWILECYRWKRYSAVWKLLWCLPLLMVVWVNSHGGFVVGFIIWGVYALNDLWGWLWARSLGKSFQLLVRHPQSAFYESGYVLWVVGIAMFLAVCINPSGAVMLTYPLKTVSIGALQDFIQEWQSPDFHQLHVMPFIWLLLLTFGAVGASRRRLVLTDFLLVAGFAYMALIAGRNIALFALVAVPALSRHSLMALESWRRALGWQPRSALVMNKKSWVNVLLLVVLALAVLAKVSLIVPSSENDEIFIDTLPVAAVSFIQEQSPPGKLFNSYNWGGYLLWALPQYPVFVDGRTDLYNDKIIGDWIDIMTVGDGWEQKLSDYGVNLILVEAGSTLDKVVDGDESWENVYRDDLAVVYVRQP